MLCLHPMRPPRRIRHEMTSRTLWSDRHAVVPQDPEGGVGLGVPGSGGSGIS